jgi:hypothetical protein
LGHWLTVKERQRGFTAQQHGKRDFSVPIEIIRINQEVAECFFQTNMAKDRLLNKSGARLRMKKLSKFQPFPETIDAATSHASRK